MRIENNSPQAPEISADRPSTGAASNQASPADTVSDRFSGDTVRLSALSAQVLQFPEVRQDKVESLRQQIASGEYKIDPKKIADAMLKN